MPDNTFKEFVLDQLSALPELRLRAMFGGYGLYSGGRFFAILFDGRLYFKVDETNRAAYAGRGMKPFTYTKTKRLLSMRYYEVPPEILEDREQLGVWASQAIQLAAATAGKNRLPMKKNVRCAGLRRRVIKV
jgi:DNA transformation protein